MEGFIHKYREKVMGFLSGFDRLVFRGTLRPLAVSSGMRNFLYHTGVLLKDFGAYAQRVTETVKELTCAAARQTGRPIRYLVSSGQRKEDVAMEIAEADGITDGLICVLSSVEPCMSYDIHRNRERKKLELVPRRRKCLHYYHYWMDCEFGLMNGRISSWFPLGIQVCINGRHWLARQMDRVGIRYERRDNCFVWIEDIEAAARLMSRMLDYSWPEVLDGVALRLNPGHDLIFNRYKVDYYWSVHQSEWATDVMFKTPGLLNGLYEHLVQGAIRTFSSGDVMRFLGRKVHGRFAGEVISDIKGRPEGVRIKHSVNGNSVKMYDKQQSVLRIETTINDARQFKVYRKKSKTTGASGWQRMRKGVADIHRRAQVSDASNRRYLEALESLDTDIRLREIVEPVCVSTRWHGRTIRGLRPWSQDRSLLETISRGEFNINGFRNRDIAAYLTDEPEHDCLNISAKVSRKLAMLRAHGLIRKVPHTHRYVVTTKGRRICAAIIGVQNLTLAALNKAAA